MRKATVVRSSVTVVIMGSFTVVIAGRKMAPNTGSNATKFYTLAAKSSKLVAKLVTRISSVCNSCELFSSRLTTGYVCRMSSFEFKVLNMNKYV